jgi:hypothetical protein
MKVRREEGKKMKKNYKLQNTNYKQCTCLKKGRCNYNVQNYKPNGIHAIMPQCNY